MADNIYLIFIKFTIQKQFKQFLKLNWFLYITVNFILILGVNIIAMLPNSTALNAHICFTLFNSLAFFIGLWLIAGSLHSTLALTQFSPKTEIMISPFLNLIEVISFFSRVGSLAIRYYY